MLDFNRIFEASKNALAETMLSTRCVGCGVMGQLLCNECLKSLQLIDFNYACSRCGAPFGHFLCTECLNPGYEKSESLKIIQFKGQGTRCACDYDGVAKAILHAYKDAGERALAKYIATFICNAIKGRNFSNIEDWSHWVDYLVQIPANQKNLTLRGFDHLLDIASYCSDWLDVPLLSILSANKAFDQRELDRETRQKNMKNSIYVNSKAALLKKETNILLIDDVLTTGASLNSACEVLQKAGFKNVRFVTFCRVW